MYLSLSGLITLIKYPTGMRHLYCLSDVNLINSLIALPDYGGEYRY